MSTDRDTTRIVRSWLEEGVTALPDRVLDAVLDQLPATSQRRAWWPARRLNEMNSTFKLAIAVAAVVVVALVGINVLPSSGDVGGPVLTQPPTQTPAPTPSPSQSALPVIRDGPLPVGTYTIGPAVKDSFFECPDTPGCSNTIGLVLTVPDGWSGVGNESILLTVGENAPPAGAGLLFTRGAGLYNDPCHFESPPGIPVGPTAEDFASALADHPLLDVTTPVDVSLAGYFGKYVDLQVPSDPAGCDVGDVYRPWEPGLYAQGPGQRWHLWILDVDGQRVVVQSTDYAGTSAQDRAELQAIVDSIKIEP
jgi:hypothetical protein